MATAKGVVSQNTETLVLSKEIHDFYDRKNEFMLLDRNRNSQEFDDDEKDDIGRLYFDAPEAACRLGTYLSVLLEHRPWDPEATVQTLKVDDKSLEGFQMSEVTTRTVDRLLSNEGIDPEKIIGWEKCFSNPDGYRKILKGVAA